MRYVVPFGILVGLLTVLVGCERKPASVDQPSDCQPVSESVWVNQRFPDSIEPYHPDSARVFTFENGFNDTVSVWAGEVLITRKFVQTRSNGLAGQVRLKLPPNEQITLRTAGGMCARFGLRSGYNYLYGNKRPANWRVEYSNYSRGYF